MEKNEGIFNFHNCLMSFHIKIEGNKVLPSMFSAVNNNIYVMIQQPISM